MRVLVDGLDTVIEGEVIGGKLLDDQSGRFEASTLIQKVYNRDQGRRDPRIAGPHQANEPVGLFIAKRVGSFP